MKNNTKRILIGTGIVLTAAGVAAAVSKAITDLLIKEALDREQPRVLQKAMPLLAGNAVDETLLTSARERGEELRRLADETVEIEAADGTRLVGHFYRAPSPKRIIIAMHGWRSSWTSDFGTISSFWHDNDCSVLYAEQRGQGASGGDHMGFGVVERHDCHAWVKWLIDNDDSDLPIYLAGISMGATTVLMTAGFPLPDRVHGIMADCGFTSPAAIWKHVAEDNLHISYEWRRRKVDELCKRKIDAEAGSYSTLDAMANNSVPVLFIHGTADSFVPVEMTYQNYDACRAPKKLLIVDGAEHGLSYIVDQEGYQEAVLDFWKQYD